MPCLELHFITFVCIRKTKTGNNAGNRLKPSSNKEESSGSAGSRTITTKLKQQGIKIGRYKVRNLMKEAKLYSKQFKASHVIRSTDERVDMLNKLSLNVNPTSPNQIWTGDITYIWAGEAAFI